MAFKHQQLFAPPLSNKLDRVVNWCEREVKNFYELSPSQQPSRITPLQLLPTRAGPARVDPYKGVCTYAVLEINRIDSNSMPNPGISGMPGTVFSANLDVHQ